LHAAEAGDVRLTGLQLIDLLEGLVDMAGVEQSPQIMDGCSIAIAGRRGTWNTSGWIRRRGSGCLGMRSATIRET
jgi:hypothetical protein